jgi:hypothetical protein
MESRRCLACHNTTKLGSQTRLGQDKGNGPKKFQGMERIQIQSLGEMEVWKVNEEEGP